MKVASSPGSPIFSMFACNIEKLGRAWGRGYMKGQAMINALHIGGDGLSKITVAILVLFGVCVFAWCFYFLNRG